MAMEVGEMVYLGFVLGLFATFASVVMWVSIDDARHRAKRDANPAAANDSSTLMHQRAA
jgi:hypothetical protein